MNVNVVKVFLEVFADQQALKTCFTEMARLIIFLDIFCADNIDISRPEW